MSNKRKSVDAGDAKLRGRVRAVTQKLGITPASKAFHVNRGTLERYLAAVEGARTNAGTIALLEKHINDAELITPTQ
jgi:hypothetical protein